MLKATINSYERLGLVIYLGSRNLAGLSRAIPDGKSACSLYRFVAQMDWDIQQVEQVRWELLNRRTRRALQAAGRRGQPVPVFLIIDDSLVEKSGQQMEGVDYHYSHSSGRTTLGHVWVTGHLVVLGQSYPVSWRLYRRKATCAALGVPFASKPELAAAILQGFEPLPGTQTYVLTDSWYPSQDLLDLCTERGFQVISAVKSDRKFKATGHNLQVKQWAQTLPKRAFDLVTVNTTCYKVWSTTGCLSSGHRVRLVVNRVIGQRKWRYLISTDQALSPHTIISYYLGRWEVENFYRVAKQSLGWGDYQMRDLFAIERHVQLMMVAHAYLEMERQDAQTEAADPDVRITMAISNDNIKAFLVGPRSLGSLT
ncbi:MAG: IS701 family transposase [Chloroflexi bacterium]|nr:IS701 family transposase [Chloroflexota bacterium]